jgi:hypothetical protein
MSDENKKPNPPAKKDSFTKTSSSSEKPQEQQQETKEVVALAIPDPSSATSTIELFYEVGQLPENRPIEASSLEIVGTFGAVGGLRPIMANTFKISEMMVASGNRPIGVSTLKISETFTVMGNRPVASNDIDDSYYLMGYLD